MISNRIKIYINLSFTILLIITSSNCCEESSYQCDNKDGDCLESEKICDGKIDCFDKSDETTEMCIQQMCPPYSFRCAYGACVPEAARCNRTSECADSSDETPVLCSSDYKSNSICMKDEFLCNSGECIALEDVCDGRVKCLDGSDETVEICASNMCEMFFRCGYGACIRNDMKCDGNYDCADGSDETSLLCMGKQQPPRKQVDKPIKPTKPTVAPPVPPKPDSSSKNTCILPDIKYSRIVYESNPEYELKAGEIIPNNQIIKYKCQQGFNREGGEFNFCSNGTWLSSIHPVCTRYCPHEVLHGITFNVVCKRNSVTVSCDDRITPGTVAIVSCPNKYRIPDINPTQRLVCTENGEWDYQPFRCEPICGDELVPSVPFLTNADNTNITAVPWHVGVYFNQNGRFKHHCGGTIISAKVIISAAHCFWDSESQNTYDKSFYLIGAGKYFRDYYKNERKAQFSNISQIAVPEEYSGADSKFQADIAVIIVNNPLIFSEFISPICIQWKEASAKSIKTGTYGQLAGWGKNEAGNFSDVLKKIFVPASSYEACKKEIQYKCVPR
ncbi:modular serine protease-like isoform X2 [Episyrphus balteatus]|uniref:modular serine protease-like isoform X2 n=1 Tax=Episyrphus balteatus TaxID=286459 RepID=UPI00248564FE|nr:modular serine protease-like isoform X2 [Episyrphus balteatus]